MKPAALLAALALNFATAARAADHVNFGTDWLGEAEYGGYYQAKAAGIYAKHGLDVDIRQGGPSVNQTQLLLAGRLDIDIASNSFTALNFVNEKIPFRVVAAMFQKDAAVLIAHPGVGHDSFEQLKGVPIMLGAGWQLGWWNFLRARFGYSDSQVRPYNFNLQPFLSNKDAVQQGFLGSEPFSIEQAAHFRPVVLLVADAGFQGYGQLFAVSDMKIAEKPDLVQRFVDASIEGWYSYLYGDPTPGNTAIKADNPEMTDALLAYGRATMVKNGILDSGDAATLGIGAMSDARWDAFTKVMVEQGVYPKGIDVRRAYTLQFINKKAGMAAKP